MDTNLMKSEQDVVLKSIMSRKSVRQYTDQPVSREQLEILVKAGHLS